jgi:membrane protein YqaA with SNARE-associated domain
VAFVWGLAEATFFFIVPDVFLTLIAVRSLRLALKGTLFALSGALIGGALMYTLGREAPEEARSLLDYVPGISSRLIARVEAEVRDAGLVAILIGPTRGIPYKLYAAEWGARRGDFLTLMLISIPARYVRFFLLAVGARVAARLLKPWTQARVSVESALHAAFWAAFYSYYFARFGL